MAFNSNDFNKLLNLFPPPVLLIGCFNLHRILWGCTKLDHREKLVEDSHS